MILYRFIEIVSKGAYRRHVILGLELHNHTAFMTSQSQLVESVGPGSMKGMGRAIMDKQTHWLLIVVKVATGLLRLCFRPDVYLLVCFSTNTNALASRQPEKRLAKGEWCRYWEAHMTCGSLST